MNGTSLMNMMAWNFHPAPWNLEPLHLHKQQNPLLIACYLLRRRVMMGIDKRGNIQVRGGNLPIVD